MFGRKSSKHPTPVLSRIGATCAGTSWMLASSAVGMVRQGFAWQGILDGLPT